MSNSRTSDKVIPRGCLVLLDTGNNFASCADHARRCLQPQKVISKMLTKLILNFYESLFFNHVCLEGDRKVAPEGIL